MTCEIPRTKERGVIALQTSIGTFNEHVQLSCEVPPKHITLTFYSAALLKNS